MPSYDLLVLGEINADLIMRGDVEPVWQQHEKIVDDMALVMGGSAAIFACGAARLGLSVAYVGVCGDDTIGNFCLSALRSAGVDTHHCVVDPAVRSGLTLVLQKPTDRAMLTYEGGIPLLSTAMIPTSLVDACRHVHVGSYYLQHALRPGLPALYARMQANGGTTSLDTNWDPSEAWAGLDTLFPIPITSSPTTPKPVPSANTVPSPTHSPPWPPACRQSPSNAAATAPSPNRAI